MDKVNKSSITNNIIIYGNYQRLVGGENGELVFNTYRVSVWEEKKFWFYVIFILPQFLKFGEKKTM